MASLGATIIVLAVALGPSTQQLVRFYNCQLPSETLSASVPRQGYFYRTGRHVNSIINDPTMSMQSSIYAAIFASQANAVPAICPTRNCSFVEPYHTLGFCSACADVTDQLTVATKNTTYIQNTTYQSEVSSIIVNSTGTNYSLPSGVYLFDNKTDSTVSPFLTSDSPSTYPWSQQFIYLSDPYQTTVMNCSDGDIHDPEMSWQCRGYGATHCSLNPCVHTYTGSVKDGIFEETLLETTDQWGQAGDADLSMVHIPCLTDAQSHILMEYGYSISNDTKWLAYNHSLSPYTGISTQAQTNDAKPFSDIVPPQCRYQISTYVPYAVEYWLGLLLTGNITSSLSSYKGPAALQVIYNNSDTSFLIVNQIFHNITMGITSNMRQSGNYSYADTPKNVTDIIFGPNQAAVGVVQESSTCVEVRWSWLAFPAAMILLTIVFLGSTIIGSSLRVMSHKANGSGDPDQVSGDSWYRPPAVWKSSLLPFMFHGLEDKSLRTDDSFRLVPSTEMEKVSESTKVKIARAEDGWKFVKTD